MRPPAQPQGTSEDMAMEGPGSRVANARRLIVEALDILDSEQLFIVAAHLGHALDLLDASSGQAMPPPTR